jgi:hypothetical protein
MKRLFQITICSALTLSGTASAQTAAVAPAIAIPAPADPQATPGTPEVTKQQLAKKDKHRKNADDFFQGPVVHLEFAFDPEEWEYIKRDHKRYAEATITRPVRMEKRPFTKRRR